MTPSMGLRLARAAAAMAAVGFAGCSRSCACGGHERPSAVASAPAGGDRRTFDRTPPGAPPFDEDLTSKLDAKWRARPPGYKPRTGHLRDDGSPMFTNRLFLESSPYLLQHAHNPVNWYAWSDEAFAEAERLHRPVFLSIGYSTCHWCHVMEEESFENEAIARYLNEHFIAIKVDREERPDVDAVYMQGVEMLTGSGGWPMSVWLTADRKPFYGGTYFSAGAFSALLGKLAGFYRDSPDRAVERATALAEQIRQSLGAGPSEPAGAVPPESILKAAAARCWTLFDTANGGLSGAPKFPSSLPIRFLLRHHRRTGNAQPLAMATLTLEKMAGGGIHDQVGGGFHRYSTDARWRVPHFEKMLYDNALLALDYLDGYQATSREDFAAIARDIFRYVDRDMTSPEGAFYSATDADSPGPDGRGEEGRFFTWTPTELVDVLGAERARMTALAYGVTESGNFDGRNVLHVDSPLGDVAKTLHGPAGRLTETLEESRDLLFAARSKRPPPGRDDEILTAWNGLMISAYARGSFVLGDPSYASRAERAADFILSNLRRGGRLLRSFEGGAAHCDAYLDDYAFLIAGLLDLFEVTGETRWLAEATGLDGVLAKHYEDAVQGGFFLTSDDDPKLLARAKPAYDGAEPSGNSVEALNLLRLGELTFPEGNFGPRAERTLAAFARTLTEKPLALSEMLVALDFRYDSPKEIVIVAPTARAEAEPFLDRLRKTFLPNRTLAVVTAGADARAQGALVPAIRGKVAKGGGAATAYVCQRQTCALPTTDPDVFERLLKKAE